MQKVKSNDTMILCFIKYQNKSIFSDESNNSVYNCIQYIVDFMVRTRQQEDIQETKPQQETRKKKTQKLQKLE